MAPRPRASVFLRLELERCAVDAIAQAALVARPVWEHMPEMAFASRANHLGAHHPVRHVAVLVDRAVLRRAGEAGPARTTVEFGFALEQRLPAGGADIFAWRLVLLVLAGERALGSALTQDAVLLRRQPLAPLGIG